MNKIHKQRLIILSVFFLGLAVGVGLILYALKQNINVFVTPTQLATAEVSPNQHVRLGGMVKPGSIVHAKEGLDVDFVITDFKQTIPVHFVGILPDLFREGKGVIAEGTLNAKGLFTATAVLAKHDENYMPKNVYETMRKNAKT